MPIKKITGLSVIIHTKNAAETLEETLQSVRFASEVIIIDMKSSDKTKKIAELYTKKIYSVPDVGYADPARNFGIEKASGPWILVVDADEVVPESLVTQLPELISSKKTTCYYLPRKNIIFSKWIERTGWWPDYQARLFKKGAVEWEVGVHKQPRTTGTVTYLPATEDVALIHSNYRSITQFIEKLNVYTSITAQEKQDTHFERQQLSGQLGESSTTVIRTFYNQFLQRLFAQKGLRDGVHGVSLSLLQSMYEVITYLKQWEYQGSPGTVDDEKKVVLELQQFSRSLRYWIADWHCQQSSGLERIYWQVRRKLQW